MTEVETVEQGDLFDAQIIPPHLALTAMRDSGYRNTAYALAELIDNSVQANASSIELFCIEKREQVRQRKRSRLWKIAVLDNGSGMDYKTLWMALQFGNGTRLNDRSGIGRFGMGLPSASISQARRLDVWTWLNGPDNAIKTYIDLDKIDGEGMNKIPEPVHNPVPARWRDLSNSLGQHGTLVVWSNLDFDRLTWKQSEGALLHTEDIVGRIYRRFIGQDKVTIRLNAFEEGSDSVLIDREAEARDPLYLIPLNSLPSPFDARPMFDYVFEENHAIEYNGLTHEVTARYSVASDDTLTEAGTANRGSTKYGKHAGANIGVSLLRAGREIMLDQGWCRGYDPRDRWWGAEIEFPPQLDEVFGLTNNKQIATHFAELATTEWEELREEGEHFIDVVNRLKEEEDPRGWLLQLSDSIRRNLNQLRDTIEAQGKGSRSSKKVRHDEADYVTKTVNEGWKERSKERPLKGEEEPPTASDFEDIRTDLTENKKYSPSEAEQLVSLIRDADLKVVFLEADFPDSFQLFNVEMKGNITEITFNRKHPAFKDIFGTVATVDEDVSELSKEEILDRLARAVNAGKIIFAAWGRYEREAGIDRAKALQRVRFDWGQIAAKFLDPSDEQL